MPAPEIDPDVVEIERALTRVAHLLTRSKRHGRTVAAAGVPVDRAAVPLLRLLAEHGGPMRPSELAAQLAVEPPHVTRQVQRLERSGYVERVPDPDDGRAQRVRLTDAGAAAVECVRAVGRRWMTGALADWPAEDRRLLAGLVHRMVDDFAAYSASDCDHYGIAGPPGGPVADPAADRPAAEIDDLTV
ncbi:MarR family winged helix-turn-helix transcriptional regulator [Actinomadura hibisca]|uniref:MarR family winged helix-turn-helix transcriptional regulator n=1 Tax=Actinomadura hibisca TaxID=68565 RepID=UPI0008309424|nr:MarR family transcriptional regulator [Actinomadura hibisca]